MTLIIHEFIIASVGCDQTPDRQADCRESRQECAESPRAWALAARHAAGGLPAGPAAGQPPGHHGLARRLGHRGLAHREVRQLCNLLKV